MRQVLPLLELDLALELAAAAQRLPPVHQAQVPAAQHPMPLQLLWPLSAAVLPAQLVSLPFSLFKQVHDLFEEHTILNFHDDNV